MINDYKNVLGITWEVSIAMNDIIIISHACNYSISETAIATDAYYVQ